MSSYLHHNIEFELAKQQHDERLAEAAEARLVASLRTSPVAGRTHQRAWARILMAIVSLRQGTHTQATA